MTDHPGSIAVKNNETGSPRSGEPVSIAVGRIRRPHGVKGEVIFEPYPEYSITLDIGKVILVGKGKKPYTIQSIRGMDRNLLISFKGLDDRDLVSLLRNQIIYLDSSELKVREDGGSYPHEVLGIKVVDEMGKQIGILHEVLLTGANDVYVVTTPEGEEVLLPAIDEVVLKVDGEAKVMTVRLPIWE
jgi:16S rRNA processing protein RimM